MNWFKEFWRALTARPAREAPGFIAPSNLTPRAVQALTLARKEAARMHHHFVGTEHVLLGLILLGQGCGVNVLGRLGVDLEKVRAEVEKHVGIGTDETVPAHIPFTPRVEKVLALADKERKALSHTYLGTEHILLGLLREGDGVAGRVLTGLGLNVQTTRQEILKELDPNYKSASTGGGSAESSEPKAPSDAAMDFSKHYDVYCCEGGQQVVYRNALFTGGEALFHKRAAFVALEQADGGIIFIASSCITKFCEPSVTPSPEIIKRTDLPR